MLVAPVAIKEPNPGGAEIMGDGGNCWAKGFEEGTAGEIGSAAVATLVKNLSFTDAFKQVGDAFLLPALPRPPSCTTVLVLDAPAATRQSTHSPWCCQAGGVAPGGRSAAT